METKHTPGPWIRDDGGWITNESMADVVQYEGCGSHNAEWQNPADMALVLAAPDLLDALQWMIDAYEHEASMKNPALLAARAAIAKATA